MTDSSTRIEDGTNVLDLPKEYDGSTEIAMMDDGITNLEYCWLEKDYYP